MFTDRISCLKRIGVSEMRMAEMKIARRVERDCNERRRTTDGLVIQGAERLSGLKTAGVICTGSWEAT